MDVLLVAPRETHKPPLGVRAFNFVVPSLGLMQLAASTPPDVRVQIVEETYQPIDYDAAVDLVGVSLHAVPVYAQACAIAERFRERGVTTALGGKWLAEVGAVPGAPFDALVRGDAEELWPTLLADLRADRLQPVYEGTCSPACLPAASPRRDLHDFAFDGLVVQPVLLSKGCPYRCSFCSVSAFYGGGYAARPLDEVVAELQSLEHGHVMFVDDNVYADPDYIVELLRRVADLDLHINCQAPLEAARDDAFLEAAQRAGLASALVGIETLSSDNLATAGKDHNRTADYPALIRRFLDHGIEVAGSFVYGFDHDGPEVFDQVLEFAEAHDVTYVLHSILTPYPNTPLYAELQAAGRLLTADWTLYDRQHAVFRPQGMTPEQLEEGYWRAKATRSDWRMV